MEGWHGGKGLRCWPWCPKEIRQVSPCAVCCKGVGNNSIELQYKLWVHKKCSGITGRLVANESFICSRCKSLGPLTADQRLRWILKVPSLMWRPLSAIWVRCCVPVGAVTVPLLPNTVWLGESTGNYYPSPPPGTSLLMCVARCTRPVSARHAYAPQ